MNKKLLIFIPISYAILIVFTLSTTNTSYEKKTVTMEPIQSNLVALNEEAEFTLQEETKESEVIIEKIAENPNYNFTDTPKHLFAKEKISVKEEPFDDANEIKVLEKREEVNILGYNEFNGYYKIAINDKEYYIKTDKLEKDINLILDKEEGQKYINEDTALLSYPGQANDIQSLPINTQVELVGKTTNNYYKILVDDVYGYVYKDYLSDEKTVIKAPSNPEQKQSYPAQQGQQVQAKYTAYYPANNTMEGGFYDARGNLLDPSKNTCAAPASIPLGTRIQVIGTGTSLDGQVFTVTDRGGGINIEGEVYHFDILMSSASECNSWGVRYGQAIILD